MDGLAASCCAGRFAPFPSALTWSGRRRPSFLALAASSPSPDESKLDKWELMELKFGRMIGEDPKLTLAKIMGRRANPDVSYLDIEKEFKKKKGKSKFEIVDIPLDWGKKEVEPSNSMDDVQVRSKSLKADKGLNLVRPVLKKGIGSEEKAGNASVIAGRERSQSSQKINTKSTGAVNMTLRKPTVLQADDIEMEKLEIKPNLSLKMRKNLLNKTKDSSGNFSNITLLKKPEPVGISLNSNQVNMSSVDAAGSNSVKESMESSNVTMLKKPEPVWISLNSDQGNMSSADAVGLSSGKASMDSSSVTLLKKPEPMGISLNSNQENMSSADAVGLSSGRASMESSNVTLSKKPEPIRISLNYDEENMSSADAVGSNSGMVSMESGGEEISEPSTMLLDQDEPKDEIRASQLNIAT